jgi:hypothetical protein
MEEMRNIHKILVVQREEKSPLERPRRRWMDTIEMNIKGTGFEDVE